MKAGVYPDLSNAAYHEETDWVSSSMLKAHLPEHFRPHTGTTSDALDFGTAFHTTVLGVGEPLWVVDAATWAGKDAKEQRASAYAAGQTPILAKQVPQLEAMAAAVKAHPEASDHLFRAAGDAEVSVFAEVDGVPCKARFDRLCLDDGFAVDLKTTAAGPGEFALTRAIIDYGYDVSADHYLRVASAAGLDVDRFVLIFVGKTDPFYVTVVELDATFYARAQVLRELALDRLQHPEMTDSYPGANGRLTVTLPRWAQLGG